MKFFSLILATYNRTETVPRLLDSLASQTFADFELIVIDQNADERLSPFLDAYTGRLALLHLHHVPGLSAARNFGLRHAKGRYLCFPDDDCWLPPHLLSDIHDTMERENFPSFLCFSAQDETGRLILPFADGKGAVNRFSIWRQCCSISFAAKRDVLLQTGGFHPQFGLGAPWGAGEDMELPIRLLQRGHAGYYARSLYICHPCAEELSDEERIQRVSRYAPSTGRIWRIHSYPLWYSLYHLSRSLGGVLFALLRKDRATAACHWAAFLGRLRGWLASSKDNTWPDTITGMAER